MTNGAEHLASGDMPASGAWPKVTLHSRIEIHGTDRIVKFCARPDEQYRVEREQRAVHRAFEAGLPVPRPFGTVTVDGLTGGVYERVEGRSMLEEIRRKPWTLVRQGRLMADIQARIHRCPGDGLPSQREFLADRIGRADLSARLRRRVAGILDRLPDGGALCHGDFHPGNIIMTGDGPRVLDWEKAMRGHPLGDVAMAAFFTRLRGKPGGRFVSAAASCAGALLRAVYVRTYAHLSGVGLSQLADWDVVATAAYLGRRGLEPGRGAALSRCLERRVNGGGGA